MTVPNFDLTPRRGLARGSTLRPARAVALLAFVSVVLASRLAAAAFVELPPPGGPSPLPPPSPTPTPRPAAVDPCRLPKPTAASFCLGTKVDEIATILANPVLQKTCGRFVGHHKGGNAVFGDAPFSLRERPGKKARTGWVMALVGCGLEKITAVEVGGTAVAAKVIPATQVSDWLASEPTLPESAAASFPGTGSSVRAVLVQFEIAADAHTAHERTLNVRFGNGSQPLERIRLQIAHNGAETSRQPDVVRWEEETPLHFAGARLAGARFVGPACVQSAAVAGSSETELRVNATFHCPVPVEGEPGVTVNDPTCDCPAIAYDRALDAYPELPKKTFNYLRSPIRVVANLDYLKANPAVIGDSLSHGAFSGTVTQRSQRWAYPHLVVEKMGGTPLVQNMIHAGPNVEDTIKTIVPARYGPAPKAIDLDARHLAVLRNDLALPGPPEELPTHTGVSGFDYTNVLRTSGICLDKRGDAERRADAKVPEQICAQRCEDTDGDELPSPSVDAQLALGCSELTPIEMIERIEPTFVFAAAAPNHALACAVTTTTEGCLEWDRFERDAEEVFRRLRRIRSIKGGVVFGIPPLSSIPYLKPHRPEEICPNGTRKLRAFWKEDFLLGEDEILDCEERAQLDDFVAAVNDRLKDLAELNRYAYVEAEPTFERLKTQGQSIRDEDGVEVCLAKTNWPTRTKNLGPDDLAHPENVGNDAGCGIFSLDGAHPSQFGHVVMANELIGAINSFYTVDVPRFDDAELLAHWEFDDLAQDPIDMDDFMRLDLGETLGEGVAVSACVAPVLACVATGGMACLAAAEIEAILALTPVRDVCLEPVARALVTELGFKPIDAAVEPAHCWDDHCPVAADATPD
jgi:hypothetical protein